MAPRIAAFVALAALALPACTAMSQMGDTLPEKAGGLPATAPARPADPLPVPNVYEVRPTRAAEPLDNAAQKKLESELTTLRESQKQRANPPPSPPPGTKKAAAAKAPPKKAAAKEPADSKKPPVDPKQQAN